MSRLRLFTQILLAIACVAGMAGCTPKNEYRELNGALHTPDAIKYDAT